MARRIVLSIDQGTDTSVSVSVTDSTGQAVDIAAARMQLRPTVESETIADELATENGRIVLEDGKIRLIFPNAVTTVMEAGAYVYDLEVVDSQDLVTRVMEGPITIRPEVTRDNPEEPESSGS